MRRNESRDDLPWAVAPIPVIPSFSKRLKLPDLLNRLDLWYGELDNWLHIWRRRNATFFRRLPKIEEQVRLLLQQADESMPEGIHVKYGFEKRSLLAKYHELLARALSASNDWDKNGEALEEYKRAISMAPEAADYWYSYVRYLVQRGSLCEALEEINAVELRLLQAEEDSIAQQILNWAMAYPEIGFGIRAEVVKHCVALVSRVGTGLLVLGCPLPHPPGIKWRRTEILRILWAGMQCSIPVDELCRREGIDEATYYRWRKRYLPPEWGQSPALV